MLAPTLSLTALFSIAHFATAAIWQPPLNAKWNIQLKSVPKLAQADNAAHNVRDFDGTDASKETIAHFHVKGKKVICYFSAGSYEDWRPDASSFPKAALGKDLDGWEGEKWLDVRSPAILTIMKARIKALKDKGCDGVDPDNIDGYGNDTGFDLTKQDAIDYLHAMAKYTHSLGAEKPVLRIEYTKKEPAPKAFKEKMCGMQGSEGFSTLIKHMALNAWTEVCPFEQPRDNGKRDAENGAVSRRGLLHAPKWWRGVNRARGQEV